MFALFTYKTPPKFSAEFKEYYSFANLKQVKVLSTTLLIIAGLTRILGVLFYDDVQNIRNYNAHSLGNWVQLSGSLIFFIISRWALQKHEITHRSRQFITLAFIVFILLVSFGVSYTVSMYNTKNTLTMFLIGIVVVSLFFAVEYKEIIMISISVILIFIISMVIPRINFEEKIMNVIASFVLAFILMCASRYSYYFKSQHFVQVKQLEEKNLEIERLNIQKSEILSFVAHDLRNPLNNISTLSSFILEENEESLEAKMIADSTKQAKEIINDLIDAVKHEEAKLQTRPTNIANYVATIVDKWRKNSSRKILLEATEVDVIAHINYSKLERAMDNIISNGLKFSNTDMPLDISVGKRNDNICIVIKDYGIGIPDKLLKYIFNQFTQAGRRGLKGEKSVGLGLHISKKIIEQHNGKLILSSIENQGSTFTILLPSV